MTVGASLLRGGYGAGAALPRGTSPAPRRLGAAVSPQCAFSGAFVGFHLRVTVLLVGGGPRGPALSAYPRGPE